MSSDDVLAANAQSQIRSIVERVEKLEAEKAAIAEHIKDVMAEAKAAGFDSKIIRKVVKVRKMDRAKRQEEEALTDLYLSACGELPLFEGRSEPTMAGGIASVTLTMENGGSVSGTPDQLAVAERMVRGVPEDDALYDQAVAIVRRDGSASTSYIQRRLQLGYNRASSLVERMEREGIVSAPNHAGKRDLLAQRAA